MKTTSRQLFALLALLVLLTGCVAPAQPAAQPTTAQAPAAAAPTSAPVQTSAAPTSAAAAAAPTKAAAPTAAQAPAAAASGTRFVIERLATVSDQLPPADQDWLKQGIDKALGVDFRIIPFSSGEDLITQLNVRLASGNPPDLISVNRVSMSEYVNKGMLLDLTPYMSKLDKVTALVGKDALTKGMIGGKLYGIPRTPDPLYHSYWIRKDWLDKLKLPVPTTLDEFQAALVAFREQDPDGNGRKDTYGLTGTGLSTFGPVFGAFGVAAPATAWGGGSVDSLYIKDGKLVNSLSEPATKDAMAYVQKMIAADVVDPEWVANTGLRHQEKAFQGLVGVVYAHWAHMSRTNYVEQYKKINPNAEWIQLPAPKGADGKSSIGSWDNGGVGLTALPKSLEKQPEKLQKVLDFFNFISAGEGMRLVQFGQLGRHYNMEGDKIVLTDLRAKEGGYFSQYQLVGRDEIEYLSANFAAQRPYWEWALKQPRFDVLNGYVTPPAGYMSADALRFQTEQTVNFVTGKRPMSEYDTFVKDLLTTYNYKAFLDAAQVQIKDLGLVK